MAAESVVFEPACERLEATTSMRALAARGTIRVDLCAAGLDPRNVSAHEMRVVAERVPPRELTARGVAKAETVCRTVADACAGDASAARERADSPDAVFQRLARA